MLTSRTFLKRTRAGAVVKVVREHYLRDDIPCGADACPLCPVRPGQPLGLEARPSGAASSLCPGPHYLLPDTNLLLHQVSASRPRLSVRGWGRPWGSGCPQRRAGLSPLLSA
uniref:PIN domain-containing protein n=1 Tax=Pavo cristatus TaxID=9049 RepID=A0A8C9LFA3_PAVCR